jgi:hypothetical protein
MSARLRSDFWVSAYLRRCNGANTPAFLRRRGAEEAGAILIKVDRLDGTAVLYGPASQSDVEDRDAPRSFMRLHDADHIPADEAERRLARQTSFDPDIWIVEVENAAGQGLLD